MKTKILATLFAFAFATSIGFCLKLAYVERR